MRTYMTINERTALRKFREHKLKQRPLTIIDRDLPAFGLSIAPDNTRTFFVRVTRKLRTENVMLGMARGMTAVEARVKALAEIEAVQNERKTGPLFRDFAEDFMRRQARRWKPAIRASNRLALKNQILPFFGATRVADITPATCASSPKAATSIERGAGCKGLGAASVLETRAARLLALTLVKTVCLRDRLERSRRHGGIRGCYWPGPRSTAATR